SEDPGEPLSDKRVRSENHSDRSHGGALRFVPVWTALSTSRDLYYRCAAADLRCRDAQPDLLYTLNRTRARQFQGHRRCKSTIRNLQNLVPNKFVTRCNIS